MGIDFMGKKLKIFKLFFMICLILVISSCGNNDAESCIINTAKDGWNTDPSTYASTVDVCHKAAVDNHSYAQAIMGMVCNQNGDVSCAFDWYGKSANNGCGLGMLMLAALATDYPEQSVDPLYWASKSQAILEKITPEPHTSDPVIGMKRQGCD